MKKRKKEIQELRDMIKDLESAVKTLSSLGGSKDSGVSPDIIIQLTQRIDKLEALIVQLQNQPKGSNVDPNLVKDLMGRVN